MKSSFIKSLTAMALFAGAHAAFAGMINDSINLKVFSPGTTDLGTKTVSSTDPSLTTANFHSSNDFYVYVTDTQIIVNFQRHSSFGASSGFTLTDLTENFQAVTLDPSTVLQGFNFGASNFSFSGNALNVDWSNLSYMPQTNLVFDITSANSGTSGAGGAASSVPEPLSLSLFGIGFLGLVATRRRKQ